MTARTPEETPQPVETPRRLRLLRHAKSSWDDAALEDHARPLNGRGRRAGRALARRFAMADPPDLVLCSDAARTRETLALVAEGFSRPAEAVFERGLYLAEARELLARLRKLPEAARDVLLIGHNPGLHELALALAAIGPAPLRYALAARFPTGALAEYRIPGAWRELPENACLVDFTVPAQLDVAE